MERSWKAWAIQTARSPFHMGAAAEIGEIAQMVKGYDFVFGKLVDQLHLVGLVGEQFQGLEPGRPLPSLWKDGLPL